MNRQLSPGALAVMCHQAADTRDGQFALYYQQPKDEASSDRGRDKDPLRVPLASAKVEPSLREALSTGTQRVLHEHSATKRCHVFVCVQNSAWFDQIMRVLIRRD